MHQNRAKINQKTVSRDAAVCMEFLFGKILAEIFAVLLLRFMVKQMFRSHG
jgi:hypothetical protein